VLKQVFIGGIPFLSPNQKHSRINGQEFLEVTGCPACRPTSSVNAMKEYILTNAELITNGRNKLLYSDIVKILCTHFAVQ